MVVGLLMVDYMKRSRPANFTPGPLPLPFLGHIFHLDFKQPHLSVKKLAEKYGNIFSLQLGYETLVVKGLQLAKETLVHQGENFAARPLIPIMLEVRGSLGSGWSLLMDRAGNNRDELPCQL
ncbi:PREDICTED: cytochrome P450 2J6-like [Crocodylus porosus]|uniref:cytochrome P450 2J6-like n=1 Tax=Crocodylus porosus TaxID=8502 RepID=UPI00093FCC36|nr:PREDICTED: cytochrome P450 2J6-like [Crocodylus porosus]